MYTWKVRVNLGNGGNNMCPIRTLIPTTGVARGVSGSCPQTIFSISSHFLLCEATSQTKILLVTYSQTFVLPQIFVPPKDFGLATPLIPTVLDFQRRLSRGDES